MVLYDVLAAGARRYSRPVRFGAVGASGVLVNSAALWALVHGVGLPVWLAGLLAAEAAVLSNFLLNDRWTFAGAGRGEHVARRLLRFNGVALGGVAISAGVLTLLAGGLRLPLLLANLAAIGCATGWNYAANSRWTWR